MPKHKTREQKIMADLKRRVFSLPQEDVVSQPQQKLPQYTPNNYNSNALLMSSEITKPLFFILFTFILQAVLFILLKNKIITIPGIIY